MELPEFNQKHATYNVSSFKTFKDVKELENYLNKKKEKKLYFQNMMDYLVDPNLIKLIDIEHINNMLNDNKYKLYAYVDHDYERYKHFTEESTDIKHNEEVLEYLRNKDYIQNHHYTEYQIFKQNDIISCIKIKNHSL